MCSAMVHDWADTYTSCWLPEAYLPVLYGPSNYVINIQMELGIKMVPYTYRKYTGCFDLWFRVIATIGELPSFHSMLNNDAYHR